MPIQMHSGSLRSRSRPSRFVSLLTHKFTADFTTVCRSRVSKRYLPVVEMGHFRIFFSLFFQARPGCATLHIKMNFCSHANKTERHLGYGLLAQNEKKKPRRKFAYKCVHQVNTVVLNEKKNELRLTLLHRLLRRVMFEEPLFAQCSEIGCKFSLMLFNGL